MPAMKRLTREQKKEKAMVDIINQMFEIAGHDVTYEDIVSVDKWWQNYTMTVQQAEEFTKWGEKYLMKELKMRAAYAEKEMRWFNVMWGLRYSDFDEHIKSKGSNSTQ
jgi:hypothetical protein